MLFLLQWCFHAPDLQSELQLLSVKQLKHITCLCFFCISGVESIWIFHTCTCKLDVQFTTQWAILKIKMITCAM